MMLQIVKYGDPILLQVAKEVDENYENLKEILRDMRETMEKNNGVGLAAPQIGLSIRAFIVGTSSVKKDFLNPKILKTFGGFSVKEEGCLSIPSKRVRVKRPMKVKIEYRDANWNLRNETFEGLPARIILHEYDHLEGKLITDYE